MQCARTGSGRALIVAAVLFTALLALPGGCGGATDPDGSAIKLRLGVQPGPQSALIFVAEDQDLFEKNGLEVTVRDYDVGYHAIGGLGADDTDVATGTEFAFVANSFSQPDLRIVASIAEGTSTSVVGRRDRGIASPGDIRGKRVAVTPGVFNQFALGKFLSMMGIGQKEIITVEMGEREAREAVEAGTVDAAVLFEPDVEAARKALGSNGYVFDVQMGQAYYWLLVSRNEFIDVNGGAVRRLLAAMLDAQHFAEDHPEKTSEIVQQLTGLSERYTNVMLQKFEFKVELPQSLLLAMEDESRWLIENAQFGAGMVPDYLDYVLPLFLERLEPEAVTIYR